MTDRIDEIAENVASIATELSEARDDIRETRTQAKITNGRVTAIEREMIAVAARAEERARVLAEVAKERAEALERTATAETRRLQSRQFWIGTTVVLLCALVGVLASHI